MPVPAAADPSPGPEVPAVGVPTVDVPAADVPAVDVPAVDVPAVDVPAVDVPTVDVPVVLTAPDAVLPAYALPGDAGADLCLAEDVELAPHQRALVGTGVSVAIPEGFAGFVHPRSGLAHRLGLSLVNAPGTIDAGYRGEIKVNLVNLDPTSTLRLARGDRVAQLVVQPVVRARFLPVADLPLSERGSGGHGSTGGAAALGADRSPSSLEGRA